MRNLLASFIVMFCVVSFAVGPVMATDEEMTLIQPKEQWLFNPNVDRMVAIGLHEGDTRMWMNVDDIPDGKGGVITALCLEDLISQPIFPAAAPARGGGMFCLADIVPVFFPLQFTATAYVSGGRNPQTGEAIKIPAKKINDCAIFVEYAQTTTAIPLLHTISCLDQSAGAVIRGAFKSIAVEARQNTLKIRFTMFLTGGSPVE